MDLQEGVKKGNVWKLESEAFKKPIEIKIWYDNHDVLEFTAKVDELKHELDKHEKQITHLNWDNVNHNLFREEFQNKVNNKQYQIDELRMKLDESNKEIKQLYKVIADQKTWIETLSGTMLKLQETISEIQKKTTKQPMVFSDRTFISGHEQVGLSILDVPSGDYLLISKYEIWNANEYVDNVPYTRYDKITVADNQYIPMYRLIGWTDLDTPTADIFWTLVFIPC